MFGSLHKTSSLFSSAKLSVEFLKTLIVDCLYQLWDVKKPYTFNRFDVSKIVGRMKSAENWFMQFKYQVKEEEKG